MTKAIEIIASHRARIKNDRKQKLYVLINNGFPESLQCAVALAICHNFSTECGMTWSGAITLGAGEALVSGQPLAGFKGGALRPPLLYVIRALNITADAIAMGCPIPEKAVRLIAKKPLPFISFDAWRWLFMQVSSKKWKKWRNSMHSQNKDYLINRIRTSSRYKLSGSKTIILDGTRTDDTHLETIFSVLIKIVRQQTGHEVQSVRLRDIRLKQCIGCFHCWNRLPGKCVHSDAGAGLLQDILQSDTVIFFSPVVFGGVSSEIKKF